MKARLLSLSLASLSSSASATADELAVTLHGPFVTSVTVGGQTISALELRTGTSSGVASFVEQDGFAIHAADHTSLEFYFARGDADPAWDVLLGAWTDRNGALPDFFMFEVGGNDAVEAAAIFPGGAIGQPIALGGWTPTGYAPATGPNAGQEVYATCFAHTDLRRPDGTPVGAGQTLAGIRLLSSTMDGAALLAVDPDPDLEAGQDGDGSVEVAGALRAHQPLELRHRGPWSSVGSPSPQNPFLDARLEVLFVGPDGSLWRVPAFFDADGNGGNAGNVWSARFRPHLPGTWVARSSFRVGAGVAVDPSPTAGTPGMLDGVAAVFSVEPVADDATGRFFLKGGVNSPENFLAFQGFDTTSSAGGGGILHRYAEHVQDWRPGDPLFRSNVHAVDGKGILGAINYLADQGVNSIFSLLMNLGGDSQDVHPYVSARKDHYSKTHFDVGRLRQWNLVFEHAARRGIGLHMGLAETESANETWMDDGDLGPERKLFLREMIARFAHHPLIKWDLCEENDFAVPLLREMAAWIAALDPYDHAIAVHNHPDDFSDFEALYGDPLFEASANQYDPDQAGAQVEELRERSAAAGQPWAAEMDENNPWQTGLTDTNADELRKRILWDVYLSGGQIEWYFGWHGLPLGGDLTVEDFRTREPMWRFMRHARRFLEENLRYWRMQPADGLLSGESSDYGGGEVLAQPGSIYALYLPRAFASGTLDLGGWSGTAELRWFDPRAGVFAGSPQAIEVDGALALGSPPSAPNEDWAAIVRLLP